MEAQGQARLSRDAFGTWNVHRSPARGKKFPRWSPFPSFSPPPVKGRPVPSAVFFLTYLFLPNKTSHELKGILTLEEVSGTGMDKTMVRHAVPRWREKAT